MRPVGRVWVVPCVVALMIGAIASGVVVRLAAPGDVVPGRASALAPPSAGLAAAFDGGEDDASDDAASSPPISACPACSRLAHPEARTRPVHHDHGRGALLARALRSRSPPAPSSS